MPGEYYNWCSPERVLLVELLVVEVGVVLKLLVEVGVELQVLLVSAYNKGV